MEEEPKLYTTQQVAAILSVSEQYVRRMVATGMAKPKGRVGHIHVFTGEEVERLRNRPMGRGRRPKHQQ